MGYPVSVLVGHTGPVTFVDFSRVHACALLSSSYDGTCRIWDATNPSQAPKVLSASAAFGPAYGVTRFAPSSTTACFCPKIEMMTSLIRTMPLHMFRRPGKFYS